MKKFYFFIFIVSIFCIGVTRLFAQTPSLQTQAPDINQSYVYDSLSTTTFGASVTFHASVNPNGLQCSVYFEYGPTTNYGHLVLAASSVSGSSAVSVSATTVLYNCGDTYHCRVKIFTPNGSYCGNDIVFVPGFDPTPKILIVANTSDGSSSSFSLTNNNTFNVSVTVSDGGTNNTTQTIQASQTANFPCSLGSTVSFYYNYTDPSGTVVYPYLFRQMPSNNQTAQEIPNPQTKIMINLINGYLGSKEGTAYNIVNNNNIDVDITAITGVNQQTYFISKYSNEYLCFAYDTTTFYYENNVVAVLYPPLFKNYETQYITATPLYTGGSSSVFYLQNNKIESGSANYGSSAILSDGTTSYTYNFSEYSNQNATVADENWKMYVYQGANFGVSGGSFAIPNSKYLYSGTLVPGTAELTASPSAISFDASPSTNYVKISSNVPWTLSSDQSWITLNKTSGSMNDTLIFTASANTTGSKRTATITLSDGYQSQTIAVTQSAYILPTQNLTLHLTSDKGVVTSGSAVTEWDDQSGNGNNAAQTTSANQPAYVQGAMNGLPVIRFNGSTSELTLPSSTALGIQNHEYEMFIVAQSSYTAQPEFLIAGGSFEQFEYHLNGAAGARFIPVTSTYLDLGTSGAYADGKPHVFEANASSTGGGMSVDGVNGGTSTSNILSSNAGNLLLGVRSDGGDHFNGDIAEVLVYDTVLTSAQRDSVEKYLADKYGITSGVLPVELTTFSANNVDGKVELNWKTATEVNNYGFEIQRSEVSSQSSFDNSQSSFAKIGFVKGSGNSNSPKNYSFTDATPPSGNVQYRLKQIDNDGTCKYSSIITVNSLPTRFSLEQNYPNPFNPTTTIQYSIPKTEFVTLKVYDELGREVTTLVNENKAAGSYSVQLSAVVNKLSSGIYIYRLQAGDYTIMKKLVLLK